jgi:hypothetical protein
MNERVKFVAAMLAADETFLELFDRFVISGKQRYEWKERYERGTASGWDRTTRQIACVARTSRAALQWARDAATH